MPWLSSVFCLQFTQRIAGHPAKQTLHLLLQFCFTVEMCFLIVACNIFCVCVGAHVAWVQTLSHVRDFFRPTAVTKGFLGLVFSVTLCWYSPNFLFQCWWHKPYSPFVHFSEVNLEVKCIDSSNHVQLQVTGLSWQVMQNKSWSISYRISIALKNRRKPMDEVIMKNCGKPIFG